MRALRSFTVRAHLPPELQPLRELATNLRWSWDERTRDLFRWADPELWVACGHDPVRMLDQISPQRFAALAHDTAFMAFLGETHRELLRHLEGPHWFQSLGSDTGAIAYFSPEFGITEALPQYSGGLGVLAGDHLKAASGLGVPLVGVGLLYRHGYFRQRLGPGGWQQERYPHQDPSALALTSPTGDLVRLDLAGVELSAAMWRADVGRVRLYMLDTDVDANDPEYRSVSDRLYGGDVEHRLQQEILLGIGGIRALEALGEQPQAFHTNEGHAGFQGLERIRALVSDAGLSFDEAVEVVRSSTIFTTHTPVPAGIDKFPVELMRRYFSSFADQCGISFSGLMQLGHFPGEPDDAPFNMAVMGLRLAGAANGVSKLHGAVSRQMFAKLWPELEPSEVPISSVTNGVHAHTWVAPAMDDLFNRSLVRSWHDAGPAEWARVKSIRDDQLWRAREQGREHLVTFVRSKLKRDLAADGTPEAGLRWCDEVLDPGICTIGFARRFAPYKRATLLLSQPERLRSLLLSSDRPIQLIFAGKAHPADEGGKDLIRSIVSWARDPELRHRIAFIEDYDIDVARNMYQGTDVWLNTPRRPMEACGTSGMKAALNGALNCSVLDGWWDEMFDGTNGWGIVSVESETDLAARDAAEAEGLFNLIEQEIIPTFYDRYGGNVPRRWVNKIKDSLSSLGPQVSAARMVREYTTELYLPAVERGRRLSQENLAPGKELAHWKRRVRDAWPQVRISLLHTTPPDFQSTTVHDVTCEVDLGPLSPHDVVVQLVHGALDPDDNFIQAHFAELKSAQPNSKGHYLYEGSFNCEALGRYGVNARLVPVHPAFSSPTEMGLSRWAT